MRLIDVDELLKAPFRIEGKFGGKYPFEAITIKMIEAAPTVDAAPVVRCGECRSLNTKYFEAGEGNYYCNVTGDRTELTDFCSHGERREKREEKQ